MMKKLFAMALAAALLLFGASALAEYRTGDEIEVVNCKEYITLRDEPSTSAYDLGHLPLGALAVALQDDGGDFVRVAYKGEYGYVLRKYTALSYAYRGEPVALTDAQRYNVNLFLSNFTEASFGWDEYVFELGESSDRALVDFAIDHIWFNQQDKLEWGEWGDDNVRLSDKYIASVTQKYFGRAPKDLSLTRMDYRDGYYYWQETGGNINNGFACLTGVELMGKCVYIVNFEIYGAGENWSNDVCHYDTAQAAAGYQRSGTGHALIDMGVGGLDDRSTWKLVRYTWNQGS